MLLQVLSKAYDENLHNLVMNNSLIFPYQKQEIINNAIQNNIKYDNFIVILHNITYVSYVLVLLLMFYGSYKYYLKQKKLW